jgi:choline dehydrogenase
MPSIPLDTPLPTADVVVVGSGPAGVAVADRLLRGSERTVLLLEAGPDFGPLSGGGWPHHLLDPTLMPTADCSWGYVAAARHGRPDLPLERARVVGGCSSHNGCAAVWGHRVDYDRWEALGNPGWNAETLLPLFQEASARWRVTIPARDDLTPWHRAVLDAAPALGLPPIPDLNDLDAEFGIAIGPINIVDRTRWSIAFALLDPLRDCRRLSFAADVLVDRLILDGTRCVGLELVRNGRRQRVAAGEVVLAGGTFGSPLVLLRSGVGPAADLAALGIAPAVDLPGVGRGLQDHPAFPVQYAGPPALAEAMAGFVAAGGLPREEGTIALARSSRCEGPFDLHLYPIASRPISGAGVNAEAAAAAAADASGGWRPNISSAVMAPRSVGSIRLSGSDPEAPPVIDHGFFTDPNGHDLAVLLEGVALSRELGASAPLAALAGAETWPGAALGGDALAAFVLANAGHDYHPTSTCRMGPAADPAAVVDARGRVRGLDGVRVADAAIMPFVPRANTNLPALVVGLRVADLMLAEGKGA